MSTAPSEIQKIGEQLEKVLKNVKGTASVFADRAVGGRYLTIDINRKEAARFGLNVQDIQEVVRTAIGGMNISETIEGRERYPINLRYPQYDRDSLDKIKDLPIVTPVGSHTSLADVADVYIEEGPPAIKSENASLTGWVLVDIDNIDVGSYMTLAKEAIVNHIDLPTGYSINWSGQYEYMNRAKERLLLVGPLTLAIIVFLLYLCFRRFAEVCLILFTLPLSLTGGLWFLYFLDYNLSVAAGVGFIGLAGVAVEIGVVMLVYLNQAFQVRVSHNKQLSISDLKESIIEGTLLRVRPIVMTVSATIVGLLPIMFGSGTGAEVMKRIAAPMVGGMISAVILALLVIPAVYYVWKSQQINNDLS